LAIHDVADPCRHSIAVAVESAVAPYLSGKVVERMDVVINTLRCTQAILKGRCKNGSGIIRADATKGGTFTESFYVCLVK
jgi:hypothetical protein